MWLRTAVIAIAIAIVTVPAIVSCEEEGEEDVIKVLVNPRKVINYIEKEFAGFSVEPRNMIENAIDPVRETTFRMVKSLAPMYLKVFGDSDQLQLTVDGSGKSAEDSGLVQVTPSGWRSFSNWTEEVGVVPVIVLDYDQDNWKPRNALKILTVASRLGVSSCLWQLGTGNVTNAMKYIEDLRAFKAMTKAFKFWGVVASDVSPQVAGVEQARFFNLNVDDIADAISVTFEPTPEDIRLNQFVLQREKYFRGPARSQLPIWLDLKLPVSTSSDGSCDEDCLQEGLRYATFLGDAARNGFKAVFKSLNPQEIQTYNFAYLIALLHRTTIGTKVFNVPQVDQDYTPIYAYCSRDGNGSLTLMGVNHEPEDFEFELRLPSKQHSTEVQQYLVTVVEDQLLLNDEGIDFEGSLEASTRLEPILKGLQLTIPAFSLGFWVVPDLNLRECFDDYQDLRTKVSRNAPEEESSVDQLLQELIAEQARYGDITQQSRRRRSVGDQLEDESMLDVVQKKDNQKKRRGLKARATRQTNNYRRRQRMIRLKEKRAERRNQMRQRRPLRERGKRNNKKLNSDGSTSKKTKRSFLAEAVYQPPAFVESREDYSSDRSGFPRGDVHLVISKGPEEDEDLISVEVYPMRPQKSHNSKKTKQVEKVPVKDFEFSIPEIASNANEEQEYSNQDEETSVKKAKIVNVEQEAVFSGVRLSDIVYPVTARTTATIDIPVFDTEHFFQDTNSGETEQTETTTEMSPVSEENTSANQEDQQHSESELSYLTASNEEEDFQTTNFNEADFEELSGERAHVQEVTRRKRSISSEEADRIEAFFTNNTKLQQKLAEMFDILLETFNCCGESNETKNTAREESEEHFTEQKLERSKRNALLHRGSWESRERTNHLRQQRTSSEAYDSYENMIPTEPPVKVQGGEAVVTETSSETKRNDTTVEQPVEASSERPAKAMLKTVGKLIKSMTAGINRMVNSWMEKAER